MALEPECRPALAGPFSSAGACVVGQNLLSNNASQKVSIDPSGI